MDIWIVRDEMYSYTHLPLWELNNPMHAHFQALSFPSLTQMLLEALGTLRIYDHFPHGPPGPPLSIPKLKNP